MKNVRSDKILKNTGWFISLILRHKPEVIGITLDEHGWADVTALNDDRYEYAGITGRQN